MQYKKIVSDGCEYIAFIGHYPDYENSELKNGGYATLTYVVAEGGSKETVEGKKLKTISTLENRTRRYRLLTPIMYILLQFQTVHTIWVHFPNLPE